MFGFMKRLGAFLGFGIVATPRTEIAVLVAAKVRRVSGTAVQRPFLTKVEMERRIAELS